jgi:hypothetical protein
MDLLENLLGKENLQEYVNYGVNYLLLNKLKKDVGESSKVNDTLALITGNNIPRYFGQVREGDFENKLLEQAYTTSNNVLRANETTNSATLPRDEAAITSMLNSYYLNDMGIMNPKLYYPLQKFADDLLVTNNAPDEKGSAVPRAVKMAATTPYIGAKNYFGSRKKSINPHTDLSHKSIKSPKKYIGSNKMSPFKSCGCGYGSKKKKYTKKSKVTRRKTSKKMNRGSKRTKRVSQRTRRTRRTRRLSMRKSRFGSLLGQMGNTPGNPLSYAQQYTGLSGGALIDQITNTPKNLLSYQLAN